MLDREYAYYQAHENELINQYDGKVIVIVGEKVVGSYPSKQDAFAGALAAGYPYGEFLIQPISSDPNANVAIFYSPVVCFK